MKVNDIATKQTAYTFRYDTAEAQYSEWTVGALSSVTCALCLYSLLAAISEFRVSIGQKMQLTG